MATLKLTDDEFELDVTFERVAAGVRVVAAGQTNHGALSTNFILPLSAVTAILDGLTDVLKASERQ